MAARARILLDACVAINLLATGRLGKIARACRVTFVVVAEVANETFILRESDGDGDRAEQRLADLRELQQSGDLEVIELSANEQQDFVRFAAEVDEGEAATLAAARHRDLPIATDDRAALRLIGETLSDPVVERTSTLLRRWAESGGPTPNEVQNAVRAVEARASFTPSRRDPEWEWWQKQRSSE